MRSRVADLERQVASLNERPAAMPGLSAASAEPVASRPVAEKPSAPGESKGEAVGAVPLVGSTEGLVSSEFASRYLQQQAYRREDPKVKELLALAVKEPDAAARATRDLWERGTAADRATAVEVLTRSSHEAFRDVLSDVLWSSPPPERAGELIKSAATTKGSPWFPGQMPGAPDVPIAGDHWGAWASLKEDMGEVVVDLDYATPVRVDGLRVHETFNPGAVARVYAKDPGGGWDLLWEGRAWTDSSIRWFEPSVSTPYATSSIRLVLDTSRIPGWNEIDAVELLGDGRRQWASGASATSTFGTGQ
jgi:hypothetical protein